MPKRILPAAAALVLSVLIFLGWVACSSSPTVEKWRTIWIETAMTTGSHQWLATLFFSPQTVKEAVDGRYRGEGVAGGEEYLSGNHPFGATEDILGQKKLCVGEKDYAGYPILVNDILQGIVISEVTGEGYRGKAMLIDDPSRLILVNTDQPNVTGEYIGDYLDRYDAAAAVNASGFAVDDRDNGAHVVGLSRTSSCDWGEFLPTYGSMVLTDDHRLVVGDIGEWSEKVLYGIQFEPVLIADGEICVEGSAGYGLQPRTAIGQRADGVIILLVIDGRDPSHSLGCTVGDMAEIMCRYGAINAGCCDGGSSSVMAYDGRVITRSCAANPYKGRQLPNAFLIQRKEGTNA